MKHVMIWLIGLYRKYISPHKPPCCRFRPTCSAYAIEAFRKRGFFMGFILTVWRILRCNPFCKPGYDPVPERGFRNPKRAEGVMDNLLPYNEHPGNCVCFGCTEQKGRSKTAKSNRRWHRVQMRKGRRPRSATLRRGRRTRAVTRHMR